MLTHSILGLKVGMEYFHPHMINQSAAYVTTPSEHDFEIIVTPEQLRYSKAHMPHLSYDDCEYMYTGFVFYRKILDFNAILLHSSAVVKDGRAYLFSAPCGTGKSTHTGLWKKVFPDAKIINDDKPAIRFEDGKVNVYGTPWSGKTPQNLNMCVPLGGICFLERAEENFIHEISVSEAIPLTLEQTIRPKKPENVERFVSVMDGIFSNTKAYRMGCNISDEAALMSFEAMSKGTKN